MKNFLIEMALYNKNANIKMLEIISAITPEILNEDAGVYYKSIYGTVEHLLLSEIIWLRRYATFFTYPFLSSDPLLSKENGAIKESMKDDISKCAELLKQTDLIFIKFINEVREDDLYKRVKYKNLMGEELERDYWNTIFHVLNHGTHHRGEISAMLDKKNISNDFSGFTKYTR